MWGKSYTGAAWVKQWVDAYPGEKHIGAIMAPVASDFNKVIGPALAAMYPEEEAPEYVEQKGEIRFANGATVDTYSSDVEARGGNYRFAWVDEYAKFCGGNLPSKAKHTLDVLDFAVRVGEQPRILVTTTPKTWKQFREWEKLGEAGDPLYRVVRGISRENVALSNAVFKALEAQHAGSRLGRQELEGMVLSDNPSALWSLSQIDSMRVVEPQPLRRIVVAVDPATTDNKNSDETGIVVVGLGHSPPDSSNPGMFHAYVLEDATGKYTPEGWARKVAGLYDKWRADKIVAESNQGGKMVESIMRSINPNLPIKLVHASKGKITRAEPVAALYGQSRVHHVGVFDKLESQMIDYDGSGNQSPDAMDALVYAITELLLTNGSSDIGGTQWLPYY